MASLKGEKKTKHQSYDGKPCIKCGQTKRRGQNKACVSCAGKRASAYYYANKERVSTKNKIEYDKNPTPKKKSAQKYYWNNTEKAKMAVRLFQRKKLGWVDGEHEKAESLRATVTKCACCESCSPRTSRGWAADHDHATGLFRGFLCAPCNIIIGYTEKHNLAQSYQVYNYLKTHTQGVTL